MTGRFFWASTFLCVSHNYKYYIASLILVTLLTGCVNSSTNSTSGQSNETQSPTIPAKEAMYNNFNAFVDKFSSDSTFQLSRTKFPLKIKWYDIDNDKDSLIYKERSSFEMMDFRKKKSTGQYDQWEQKIVVDKNNTSATIEIRGIENGIMVDYLFEKINGAWMLIEIDDSST
ncbi:MAG: DUF4348 domain-containing protein [Saprospiraceae bacterium]|nr:DUF4348 domain-containing protein [Saprospiraceae bacterium]